MKAQFIRAEREADRVLVVALMRRLPTGRWPSLLARVAAADRRDMSRALIDLIDPTLPVAVLRALLHTLRALDAAEAEGALRRLLFLDDQAVALEAARALGDLGTTRAVALLRELRDDARSSDDLRRAADEAIATIHTRHQAPLPGALSLEDPRAGALASAGSYAADDPDSTA